MGECSFINLVNLIEELVTVGYKLGSILRRSCSSGRESIILGERASLCVGMATGQVEQLPVR
jgi:hypothetical protein